MLDREDWIAWLEWFHAHADFGPAHSDVMDYYHESFTRETGIEWLEDEV